MTLVAVVDDHRLFSCALGLALRRQGLDVVEPELTPPEGLASRLAELSPDVVILDLDLAAAGNGDVLVAPLASGGASVVIVSAIADEARIGRCLALGALSWVPKSATLEDLTGAVLDAAKGRSVQTRRARARLIDAWRLGQPEGARPEGLEELTPREAYVLGQLMRGRTVAAIADTSFVSSTTVRSQVRSILEKLNVGSQLQAVVLATRCGWVGTRPDARHHPEGHRPERGPQPTRAR